VQSLTEVKSIGGGDVLLGERPADVTGFDRIVGRDGGIQFL
jgi:hypothetical protein